jgi:small conductance mechanosensitive channel
VNTARPLRRSQYDVGIGYGDDIEAARAAILEAISKVEAVVTDPAPEVIVFDLAASSVNLRIRWWTPSKGFNLVRVQGEVLEGLKHALDAKGIDIPYATQVMLFHDQTEETDGKRGAQREGWPQRPKGRRSGRRDGGPESQDLRGGSIST